MYKEDTQSKYFEIQIVKNRKGLVGDPFCLIDKPSLKKVRLGERWKVKVKKEITDRNGDKIKIVEPIQKVYRLIKNNIYCGMLKIRADLVRAEFIDNNTCKRIYVDLNTGEEIELMTPHKFTIIGCNQVNNEHHSCVSACECGIIKEELYKHDTLIINSRILNEHLHEVTSKCKYCDYTETKIEEHVYIDDDSYIDGHIHIYRCGVCGYEEKDNVKEGLKEMFNELTNKGWKFVIKKQEKVENTKIYVNGVRYLYILSNDKDRIPIILEKALKSVKVYDNISENTEKGLITTKFTYKTKYVTSYIKAPKHLRNFVNEIVSAINIYNLHDILDELFT